MTRVGLALITCGVFGLTASAMMADELVLELRSQREAPDHSGHFERVARPERWPSRTTAVIVCDVWDLHHCWNAVRRMEEFVPRLNEVLIEARRRGCVIIHAPSDCIEAYADHPARRRAIDAPSARHPPAEIETWCSRIPAEERAAYPIDQSDGGEDDEPAEHAQWSAHLKSLGRNPGLPWKRQSKLITIDEQVDYLSDRGDEVWNILEHRGIETVILTGVHANMCVLGRPFGLRQLVRGGKKVVLMRDMTDSMYNPNRWPYVDHFTGNDLIVSHIERYVCPTMTSDQILGGQPFHFKNDRRATRDVMDPSGATRVNRETFERQWNVFRMPSTWQTATQGVVEQYEGVAWYRCAVRLSEAPPEPPGLALFVPTENRRVKAWCNGQALTAIPSTVNQSTLFQIPRDAFHLQDANLIVLRVEHAAGPAEMSASPKLAAGPSELALEGRWQFRWGDDPAWTNMPLPAKFGIATDILFQAGGK